MCGLKLGKSNIVAFLGDIFERRGAENYLGQKISMAEHMLHGAALAEARGASDELIAAILLHDVKHFTSEFGAYSPGDRQDKYHDIAGGHVFMPFFPPRVSECVRLHVAAKRYLCVKNSAYFDQLSSASVHTLSLKGSSMSADEVTAFEESPCFKRLLMDI